MTLRVYNTLTRQKEPFQTVEPGKVRMYVCGPTVYKPSHIGHMVGPVIFDTVRRYLAYLGYDVTFVVNITDVDDKLIKRAQELHTTVKELAERMTADYLDCLKRLGVEGITHLPKATEHIADMVRMIQGLIDKGHAYPSGGDVYFDVTRDADYGKLCHRDPEQMEAGARIEVSDRKRNPGDFALWKGSKPGEPAWDSPWGPGRPGWHIECSAMSMRYLGDTLDIHGGGLDLQFPHHENELAQSESYTEKPFVRYWMHNGLLKMGTAKMAGSVGNVINVADLLAKFPAETVRFMLLSTHYRSPIEYSEERLNELSRAVQGFYRFFERYQRITGESLYQIEVPWMRPDEFDVNWTVGSDWDEVVRYRERFLECMDDDFNTGGAIGVLFELLTALNRYVEKKQLEGVGKGAQPVQSIFQKCVVVLKELSRVLGIFLEPQVAAGGKLVMGAGSAQVGVSITLNEQTISSTELQLLTQGLAQLLTDLGEQGTDRSKTTQGDAFAMIQLLIDLRAEAKKAKNYALGDQIRERLKQLGVTLEDRRDGTGWRRG